MRHGKLLAAVSIATIIAGAPAFAADDAISPRAENPEPGSTLTTNENGVGDRGQTDSATSARSAKPDPTALSENELSANNMINKVVFDADGEEIGEIVEITSGGTGGQPKAVVATSEFLGFGEREIAIPLGKITESGGRLQALMTASELEALPEYKTETGGDVRQNAE